jgi:hypothetical protein
MVEAEAWYKAMESEHLEMHSDSDEESLQLTPSKLETLV